MFRGLFIVCLVFLGGCQFFQPKEESTEVPVARVNETFLYESDLAGLIAAGTSTEDSAQFAERFISNWIRKQLIIDKAQNELDLNEAEIEQKVLDYRYALTRSAFEKQYIFENLEESVSEEEIQEYYASHSEDFVLKQNIVRCLFAKVANEAPRIKRFEKDIQGYPTNMKLDDLKEYGARFASKSFLEDSIWVDFNEVIAGTPFDQILDKNRVVRTRQYLKEADENFNYYFRILEYKMVDDVSPIEFVRENITDILINKRKIALKKELEDKVYAEAVESKVFEIYSR